MSKKYPSHEMDRFNVRLPAGMRDDIAKRAESNGRSMNSEIVQILEDALYNVEVEIADNSGLFKGGHTVSLESKGKVHKFVVDEVEMESAYKEAIGSVLLMQMLLSNDEDFSGIKEMLLKNVEKYKENKLKQSFSKIKNDAKNKKQNK